MLQHIWTVLSHSVAIDKATNQLSVFEVVEEFNIHARGMVPPTDGSKVMSVRFGVPTFTITTLWTRTDPKTPCRGISRVVFIDPANKESVLDDSSDIDLTEFMRTRQILKLVGLPFTISGRYRFEIRYKNDPDAEAWTIATALPLDVTLPQSDPPNSPPS